MNDIIDDFSFDLDASIVEELDKLCPVVELLLICMRMIENDLNDPKLAGCVNV